LTVNDETVNQTQIYRFVFAAPAGYGTSLDHLMRSCLSVQILTEKFLGTEKKASEKIRKISPKGA
jgi:hypothetical protein